MSIKQEIESLKTQIDELTKKEVCGCGKTLFMYDDKYLYVKCKHCKKINQFKKVV